MRGHHLLCVHGFQGMGYNSTFVEKMREVVQDIRNADRDFPIRVTIGLDETCAFCPHKKGDRCHQSPDSQAHVLRLDKRVVDHLGIEEDGVYSKKELVSRVAKKVSPDDLDYLCEGCSWLDLGVCKVGIANLKAMDPR